MKTLRIIAGEARGRRIITPTGIQTRPTSDRVKESMFNILGDRVPGSKVLDLFAGTGSLGLESISRGAQSCVCIDNSKESIKVIYQNINMLKFEEYCEVYHNDAFSALSILGRKDRKFNIIFVDPPYHKEIVPLVLKKITDIGIIEGKGVIVSEHDSKDSVPEKISDLVRFKSVLYGDTALSFYISL